VEQIAVEHQQRGDEAEAEAHAQQAARGGDDTDRAEHDGNLEERLREVKAGDLPLGPVALLFIVTGLLQQLRLALPARRGVVLIARDHFGVAVDARLDGPARRGR